MKTPSHAVHITWHRAGTAVVLMLIAPTAPGAESDVKSGELKPFAVSPEITEAWRARSRGRSFAEKYPAVERESGPRAPRATGAPGKFSETVLNDVTRRDPLRFAERRRPIFAPPESLTAKALVVANLGAFDRLVLNRFTVPLVGLSNEARAWTVYAEEKRARQIEGIRDGIELIRISNPAQARALEPELKSLQAASRSPELPGWHWRW